MPATDVRDHVEGERLVVHLDAPHEPLHRAEQVVVDQEPLERLPHQAADDPGIRRDEVAAGERGSRDGDPLLVAGLRVHRLRVGHPGGDAGDQAEVVRDLRARRHQQRLLPAASRERTGAQVGDERPHAEVERRSPAGSG